MNIFKFFKKPKTKVDWADEVGSWLGVFAALLLASKTGLEGIAFIIFIFSVGCYIYVAHIKDLPAMKRMNVIFFFINLLGIWRWIISPWLLGI